MLAFVVGILAAVVGCNAESIPASKQVHIAFNPGNRIAISWVTYLPYAGNELPVAYITSQKPISNNISNSSTVLTGYTLVNEEYSRYYHHCITDELIANQTYYYQAGKNGSIFSFNAPINDTTKKTDDNTPLLTMIAYGDLGVTNSANTIALLRSMTEANNINYTNIDFISHIGDISYADDRDEYDSNPKYIPIYDEWGELLEPIFSHVPYMVGAGNHEVSCHSWTDTFCHADLKNFSTYRHYFRMPQSQSGLNEYGGGSWNLWYSYNFKNVHFIMIDTESDYVDCPCVANRHKDIVYPECGPFGDQYTWLKADLETTKQNKDISWIIAMGHRPMYSSTHKLPHVDFPPLTSEHLRENFEKLFHEYHVDLYLSGHIHAYERLYPIYKDELMSTNYSKPQATVGITNGAAGCTEGHQTHGFNKLRNFTATYNDKDWGIGILNIYNDSVLNWKFIGANDANVIDEIWLQRDPNDW